eukprot:TRINITY_DN2081_c0_g1_i5.p1 TRINITY_DN2081_c0_g1~~TRINITY_DN2081_c0_g1_i5.p1  ORF type:complete len:344 (+),score=58.56 TRINITY_DN2081_c0_g1_i5:64-1032(+)
MSSRQRTSRSPHDESPPHPRSRSRSPDRRRGRRDPSYSSPSPPPARSSRYRPRSYSRSPPPRRRAEDSPDRRRRSPAPPSASFERRRRRRNSPPSNYDGRRARLPQRARRPAFQDQRKYEWGGRRQTGEGPSADDHGVKKKEEPCYEPSGNLYTDNASRSLTVDDDASDEENATVKLKYTEPSDAAFPDKLWRFYVFKGDDCIETLHLARLSFYVVGKDSDKCQIPLLHPTISKYHAVVQFRKKISHNQVGDPVIKISPYVIDLNSTNGTLLNGDKIEPQRYYELKKKDCLKFGASSRDFVLMVDKKGTASSAVSQENNDGS